MLCKIPTVMKKAKIDITKALTNQSTVTKPNPNLTYSYLNLLNLTLLNLTYTWTNLTQT